MFVCIVSAGGIQWLWGISSVVYEVNSISINWQNFYSPKKAMERFAWSELTNVLAVQSGKIQPALIGNTTFFLRAFFRRWLYFAALRTLTLCAVRQTLELSVNVKSSLRCIKQCEYFKTFVFLLSSQACTAIPYALYLHIFRCTV